MLGLRRINIGTRIADPISDQEDGAVVRPTLSHSNGIRRYSAGGKGLSVKLPEQKTRAPDAVVENRGDDELDPDELPAFLRDWDKVEKPISNIK